MQNKKITYKRSTGPRIIWLQKTKSFIKISDACGNRKNNGLITLAKRKPVWVSLKKLGHSPTYLIGDIASAGGDFCGEIGYQLSRNGHAICNGGRDYKGGVPFHNLDEAFSYLAQYFDVRWCEDVRSGSQGAKMAPLQGRPKELPTPAQVKASTVSIALLSCVARELVIFLSHASPSKTNFGSFYNAIRTCLKPARLVLKGQEAHRADCWTNHPGVYVVRDLRNPDLYDSVLYVGMTGKLTRSGTQMTGRLSLRPGRWDPYCFKPDAFSYGYDRKARTYTHKLRGADFEVECFTFDEGALSAPSILEAVILQAYALAGPNRLPPANNAF